MLLLKNSWAKPLQNEHRCTIFIVALQSQTYRFAEYSCNKSDQVTIDDIENYCVEEEFINLLLVILDKIRVN